MDKQSTGFKFGKYRTKLIRICGEVKEGERIYKLVEVEVEGGSHYLSIRLYNKTHRFIKQFMFEPWILNAIIDMFIQEANK